MTSVGEPGLSDRDRRALQMGQNGRALYVLDDDGLVDRIKAGDQEALGELYGRHVDGLLRYARSIMRDPDGARDLCNEVFLSVMRNAHRYDPNRGPFRGWLFALARNRVIDTARTREKAELHDTTTITEMADATQRLVEPALPSLSWISDKDLLILIGRLPEDQREALILRYQFGLNTREIAQVMRRSPRAVNDLDSRARRFLVQRLDNLGRDVESFRREWTRMKVRRVPVIRARRFALAGPTIQAPAMQRLPATAPARFGSGRRW